MLIDTRGQPPDPPPEQPSWWSRVDLRVLRWPILLLVMYVVSFALPGWPGLAIFYVAFFLTLWRAMKWMPPGGSPMRDYKQ